VRPAAAARREALATSGLEADPAVQLGLRPGDERGQAIDAVADRNHRLRLRLRLKLRLRTMVFALVVLARLMIVFARLARLLILHLSRLVRLRVPLLVSWLVSLWIARHKRLRLDRNEARLGAEIREALALIVAILRGHLIFGARLRLVLAKLFLGGCDQPEIVLGMLIIIFRRHRIAGTSRVARQLDVFLSNVGCSAANLDVGAVGLENPGHRVLTTPVIIIVVVIVVIVVSVTHPLVVVILTVSHVSPFYRSIIVVIAIVAPDAGRATRSRIAMQFNSASILPYVAFNKTRSPTASVHRWLDQIIQPGKTSPGFLA
jgi:hypothetical protein